MVDQNNAKETDQFNEAYLWTQSVLNNLRGIGQAEDYRLKLSPKKSELTTRSIVNKEASK
ncbi:hypothetical protein [Staphylococcus epidermidis]|uniref:hypothetical protein n=1 Tax=Staphylococcus epidermidis TaxID=1282 RepID=UPI000517818D|nr:hypothetical protein [Staphylococcus epidermidis]RTE12694.1 hypothetical protein BKL62_09705 [Staphylococcus epidermidis]RTE14709.1 hypothetical protein BKL64_04995 [Staphylococcus epidermidis]RTE18545.1 hypothetical protein BKL67_11465 [Staphylococcus epidermidis]RTE19738.1 hypothetical protein BKL71_08850 [Staphylococcus epidermidis]RTE20014.1 hypothetical protein BKL66_08840 [Staphylococcus epidermidis]